MDFTLNLSDIPAPLRPAADVLADRHLEIITQLQRGLATQAWAAPRLASINLALDLMRHPSQRALAWSRTDTWPEVRNVREQRLTA